MDTVVILHDSHPLWAAAIGHTEVRRPHALQRCTLPCSPGLIHPCPRIAAVVLAALPCQTTGVVGQVGAVVGDEGGVGVEGQQV